MHIWDLKKRQKCVRIFHVAFVTGHKFLCLLAKQLSHYFSSTFIILVPAVNHHLCFAVLLRVVFRKWQNRPSLSSPFAARVEDTKQFDTKPSLSTSLPVSVLELRRWNIFLVQNHLFPSQVPRLLACQSQVGREPFLIWRQNFFLPSLSMSVYFSTWIFLYNHKLINFNSQFYCLCYLG